jgi:hypothetical protein
MICTGSPATSDLVTRQLVERGFGVRSARPGPLDASMVRPGEAFDLVVEDLDMAELELSQRAVSLRTTFPYVPLMLLSYARPRSAELERLYPCVYLRKPPDTDELSAVLDSLTMSAT